MKKIAFLLVLKGDSSGEIYLKTLGFRGNFGSGTCRREESPRLSCPRLLSIVARKPWGTEKCNRINTMMICGHHGYFG